MQHHERETYRLHAKLPVYRRRVERAMQIVRDAIEQVPGLWGVGCSGGKDSVALAFLAHGAGWRGPLYHFWSDETPVENTTLVADVAGRLSAPLVTVKVAGAFDVFEATGRFFISPETDEEKATVRSMLRDYKTQAEEGATSAGMVGLMWGLRAEESRQRAIVIATKKTLYQVQSRQTWTALPLAYWTGRDVWAFLCEQGLPWLETYDRSDDRERQRSEVTWLAAPGIWRHGQGQMVRAQSPALWARLCQRWPELSAMG